MIQAVEGWRALSSLTSAACVYLGDFTGAGARNVVDGAIRMIKL